MDPHRRDHIQRSLRTLVEVYSTTLRLLEDTFKLLDEDSSVNPTTYLQRRGLPQESEGPSLVNAKQLSVTFKGKTCFLGNSLPFRFLCRLAKEPNTYVSYQQLLADVWDDRLVSDSAVRSVVKTLRSKLRQDGLAVLADAIDGTERGHYVLKLNW